MPSTLKGQFNADISHHRPRFVCSISSPHGKRMWSALLLLSYLTDEETEAQRGGVTRPQLASARKASCYRGINPWHRRGRGGPGPRAPLPMYMELALANGLAGRMEFCRASSSLEGGGS